MVKVFSVDNKSQQEIQNFQGANLQNRNFRGQNLAGADFSYADIRGANFSGANLAGANFQGAKAGLTSFQTISLFCFCIFLTFFAGLISAYAGALVHFLLTDPKYVPYGSQFIGFFTLAIYIALLTIIFYKGLGFKFIILAVIVIVSLLSTVALGEDKIATSAQFAILALVGTNAGFASIATALAIAKIMTFSSRKVIAAIALVSLLGTVFGFLLGVPVESNLSTAIPITTLVAFVTIAFGFYIGNDAISENSKYKIIRYTAIDSIAARGTKFCDANLTDADFTRASLKSTDFRKANLIRTCFFGVKQLNYARIEGTYLDDIKIRKLVITKVGKSENFDGLNLYGVNLENANLEYASFINTNLSSATLKNANLAGAVLGQAQLYKTCLTEACLTGAYIENWGISTDTEYKSVKCDFIYMRVPTKENPDPWRKPDNRDEFFREGDFGDFIAPIIKTLDLYQKQNIDMRQVAKNYKTLDLFHYDGIDPSAAAVALKQLAENHPEAGLEIIALEGRGKDKVRVQAKISSNIDSSELDREYFDIYSEAKSLPLVNVQAILEEMGEQYKEIHKSLDNKNNQYYIQINQTEGDLIMSEAWKKESNLNLQNAQFSGGLLNAETINGEQVGGNITNNGQEHKSKPVSTANVNSAVKTILILAVNPRNTSTLRLDEEVREIDNGLQRAKKRELFEIKQRWAVRVQELHQSLLDFKPQIVHFSGHGVENEGLALEDESGNTQLISTEALSSLFELFASHVECVVLNACYSEVQAVAIAKHIPYVVGMNKAIGDKAAIKFSTGFYNALLSGESVEFAYKLGCNVIQLDGIPEHLTPVLKKLEKLN